MQNDAYKEMYKTIMEGYLARVKETLENDKLTIDTLAMIINDLLKHDDQPILSVSDVNKALKVAHKESEYANDMAKATDMLIEYYE